jgi:type IV pilus assembly protein PilY1
MKIAPLFLKPVTPARRSLREAIRRSCLLPAMMLAVTALPAGIQAATTDLASSPMVTSSTSSVLPNLMFILDDSGSMGWSYMPDVVGNNFEGDYGYSSSQCNGVYYDPSITYQTPVDANGTSFPNATFTAAWVDGFKTSSGTVNLSSSFRVDSDLSAQPAFYYKYTGTQTTSLQKNYYKTSGDFYKECNSQIGDSGSPGYTVFTKVVVGASEQQNFANWYSYYRTRMLMMKSAAGRAFVPIDNRYRVGYMSINNNTSSDFLNITTFDATQKTAWYAKLYAAKPNNSTPLRDALSKAGKLYTGKLSTLNGVAVVDPVQYSCQQNFTLLSTDGFWNGAAGSKIDGAAVGNQDGSLDRPYRDGSTTTYSKSTSQVQMSQTRVEKSTSQLQKRTVTQQKRTSNLQRQVSQLRKRTSQLQKRISGTWTNVSSCTGGGSTCRYASWTSYVGTSACTPLARDSSSPYTIAVATECQTAVTTAYTTVSSCTASAVPDASGYTTQCQYTSWSAWANSPTCAAQVQSASSPYVGPATECNTTDTGWVGSSSCSPSSSGGVTVTCQSVTTGPTPVASCTAASPSSGNGWTATTCATTTLMPATGVASCTAEGASSANGWVTTSCNTVNTGPTAVASCIADAASAANNWTTTTCGAATTSGGTSDTLADVAYYYYATDLRDSGLSNTTGVLGVDVAENNVPVSGLDGASWQHMTTFTLGLGAPGRMIYTDSNYKSATSGDYHSIKTGAIANPSAGVCPWQASGTACNWPTPGSDKPENIDDLWHAAVNGHGTYFSATNPTTLAGSITEALAGVTAITGASAAATTSNPNVTAGDNFVFESTFTQAEWHGELSRRTLDLDTGAPLAAGGWSARDQLDSNAARTLYTFDAGAPTKLKPFAWGSLNATEQSYFGLAHISGLTQFCASGPDCLTAASKTAAAGSALVDFLRGDRSNEGSLADNSKYFRQRQHLLGDIVNAEAVYVRSSLFNYADPGYSSFASSNSTRQGIVYAAANDGMLHAFNADTGAESWAFIPSRMLPQLYKLADKNYINQHQFFLDGTPTVGDIQVGGSWKTILVGGMNAGGRGYYALDITDPASPKAIWEFADTNLGYTYGNPVITKLKDGTWVVLVTSGYNNVSPGDGVGRLYVLNAATGSLIRSISTGVGSTGTPSGLGKIAAWVESAMTDNTATRVYGGDLQGNLWRFDINGDVGGSGFDAQLLVTLKDPSGTVQSITTKPELGLCGETPMILAGTGRFLGTSDLANTQQQSFYGVKDELDTTTHSNPRLAGSSFIKQTMTADTCPSSPPGNICVPGTSVRTSTNNAVNLATDNGWYVDFLTAGERANTDPTLVLGTLTFNTNIPDATACSIGGYSYINYLNYCSGAAVTTADGIASVKLGNALATRPVVIVLPNHSVVSLTRLADGTTVVMNQPPPNPPGSTRRVSWRELTNE